LRDEFAGLERQRLARELGRRRLLRALRQLRRSQAHQLPDLQTHESPCGHFGAMRRKIAFMKMTEKKDDGQGGAIVFDGCASPTIEMEWKTHPICCIARLFRRKFDLSSP
jgi:hypothetical protein